MADEFSVQKYPLYAPSLEEVAGVLENGLKKNFKDVEVSVTDCPDLSKKPFMLASEGICGSPKVTDIGGVPNLVPLANKDKIYKMSMVPKWTETPNAFMVGAGAAPRHVHGVNAEMMPNLRVNTVGPETCVTNNTHICDIDSKDENYRLLKCTNTTDCCLLMNLYVSEGKPGKVLSVKVSKRIGPLNYMNCIRHTLADHYGDKPVALGGTFLIEKGKAKIHVMPDYSTVPLNSDEEVDNWLRFFEMETPLVCLGYLVSHDPGLDLRIEHFHCFSDHGDGGHYHYDTTPDEVCYQGYLNVAEFMYRVDRPKESHMIGRD